MWTFLLFDTLSLQTHGELVKKIGQKTTIPKLLSSRECTEAFVKSLQGISRTSSWCATLETGTVLHCLTLGWCRAWKSVIVGCFTYLKGLETASLVPGKISLTKLFPSLAKDRTFYFYEYNSHRNIILVTLKCSAPSPPHFNVTRIILAKARFFLWQIYIFPIYTLYRVGI